MTTTTTQTTETQTTRPSRKFPAVGLALVTTVAVVVGLGITASRAESPQPTGFHATNGVAVDGYDVVAYFTDGRPTPGTETHTSTYGGVEWRFASEAHKTLFDTNPEQYVPQYGGYCAWGLAAKDKLFPTDPHRWSVVDGRLFLNFNEDVQQTWTADREAFIAQADRLWPTHATATTK